MTDPAPTIAYLAPALTALEATFVYQELLALERLNIRVVPVSVHRPARLLVGHDELLARTIYLYDGGPLRTVLRALRAWARPAAPARGRMQALRWLVADIARVGPHRPRSWKMAYHCLVAATLADVLLRHDCRHLHVHFAHVPAQIAMYACAMACVPYTVMAHANDIFERGLLLREKALRAAKMLTISRYNLDYLVRTGVPAERLAVVRCGVSFAARADAAPPRLVRRNATHRIGTLGRLVEKKGIDVLIRALPALIAGHGSMELEVAGEGPLEGHLRQSALALGVAGCVRFTGNLPHHAVREWMQGLDIFVLACKPDANGDMDGIPVVLMEAMSQGIPVVSTRLSGIPELVVHEITGLLAHPGDSADLARQIGRLLGSPDLRAAMAGRALAHVRDEFGQAANLQRLLGYFELPGGRPGDSPGQPLACAGSG